VVFISSTCYIGLAGCEANEQWKKTKYKEICSRLGIEYKEEEAFPNGRKSTTEGGSLF